MDEARKLKTVLYPLSRDVRNLRTFVSNINNVLQAAPQRFAVAAPIGLLTLRNSVRSLAKSTHAIKEVNDITLQESMVAASLSERTQVPLLRPAAQLNVLARDIKPQIDRAHNSVLRIAGYLNPLFVFMAAMIPVVDNMARDLQQLDDRLTPVKKTLSRLVDQELTSGLPLASENQIANLVPQFAVIEQETSDISAQVGLLMGKMNRLSELSSKLELLLRMSAALDGAIPDLIPAMAVLKNLGSVLLQVQKSHDPRVASLSEHVNDALSSLRLPGDALLQLEVQLVQQREHYIDPIVEPLHDLVEQLRARVPNNHELNGLESTMMTQNVRLGNVEKLISRLFNQLDHVMEETRHSIHAA